MTDLTRVRVPTVDLSGSRREKVSLRRSPSLARQRTLLPVTGVE